MRRAKNIAVVSLVVGGIMAALYPITVMPMLNKDQYANKQKEFLEQENLSKEEIQPAGLPVWSDPFDKKKRP